MRKATIISERPLKIDCHDIGDKCLTHITETEEFFFIHPKLSTDMQKEIHDDTLSKLTDDLNNLVRQASEKRKDKNLALLLTSEGFIPIWCTVSDKSGGADIEEMDDDAILKAFGLKQ